MSLLSLRFYWCTWCSMLRDIHLVSWVRCPSIFPFQPLAHPSPLAFKGWGSWRGTLDPVQQVLFSSSQITDVLTALFNTDAEPCTLRAAVRSSISSIPTSPDQHCNCTGITWDSEDTLEPLLLNPTCWICPSLFFAGFLCLRAVGWKQSSLFHDPWQDFTSELVEEVGFGEELLTSRVWDLHNLELFSTGVQTCTSAALCKCVCRHHWC